MKACALCVHTLLLQLGRAAAVPAGQGRCANSVADVDVSLVAPGGDMVDVHVLGMSGSGTGSWTLGNVVEDRGMVR